MAERLTERHPPRAHPGNARADAAARALGLPASTVRDWLRKARRGADTLDRNAVTHLADLDRDVLAGGRLITPAHPT